MRPLLGALLCVRLCTFLPLPDPQVPNLTGRKNKPSLSHRLGMNSNETVGMSWEFITVFNDLLMSQCIEPLLCSRLPGSCSSAGKTGTHIPQQVTGCDFRAIVT